MKKHSIYLLIFGIFIFSSCERLVTNIEPPKAEKELVMFSFLSPEDEKVSVELSYSSPVFGTTDNLGEVDFINDALVIISNNDGEADTMQFNSSENAYLASSTFKIKPGKIYTVRANYAGKTVSGSTIVPSQMVLIDTIETLKSVGDFGENNIKIKTIWTDPGLSGTYYRIYNEQVYSFNGGNLYSYGICSEYLSNQGKANKKFTSTCESGFTSGGSGTNSINVYLLTTDVHYYEYHRRRANYFGDDPFSEPIPQYMNVQGGIGVVASYRKTQKEIKP